MDSFLLLQEDLLMKELIMKAVEKLSNCLLFILRKGETSTILIGVNNYRYDSVADTISLLQWLLLWSIDLLNRNYPLFQRQLLEWDNPIQPRYDIYIIMPYRFDHAYLVDRYYHYESSFWSWIITHTVHFIIKASKYVYQWQIFDTWAELVDGDSDCERICCEFNQIGATVSFTSNRMGLISQGGMAAANLMAVYEYLILQSLHIRVIIII